MSFEFLFLGSTASYIFCELIKDSFDVSRQNKFMLLFDPPKAQTLAELERLHQKERKRGRL